MKDLMPVSGVKESNMALVFTPTLRKDTKSTVYGKWASESSGLIKLILKKLTIMIRLSMWWDFLKKKNAQMNSMVNKVLVHPQILKIRLTILLRIGASTKTIFLNSDKLNSTHFELMYILI